jgi:hypothetical protein
MGTSRQAAFSGPAPRILFGVSARGRLVYAVLGLFTGLVSAAEFTPPSIGRPASETAARRDWEIAVQARRALFEDPTLAPLNLGVSVRQRIAMLWGPVPSAAIGLRAVDRVRRVLGVAEVRSELYIEASGELPGPAQRDRAPERLPSLRTTSAADQPQPAVRGPGVILLAPVPLSPAAERPRP